MQSAAGKSMMASRMGGSKMRGGNKMATGNPASKPSYMK